VEQANACCHLCPLCSLVATSAGLPNSLCMRFLYRCVPTCSSWDEIERLFVNFFDYNIKKEVCKYSKLWDLIRGKYFSVLCTVANGMTLPCCPFYWSSVPIGKYVNISFVLDLAIWSLLEYHPVSEVMWYILPIQSVLQIFIFLSGCEASWKENKLSLYDSSHPCALLVRCFTVGWIVSCLMPCTAWPFLGIHLCYV
jgi:hypothetical protein